MKPLSSHSLLESFALATLPVVGAFVCWFMVHTAHQEPDVSGVTIALATINAPCKDNGHEVICGTLAQMSQTTKNIGILAAQGAEQIKQSGTLIQATTRNLDAVGSSVQGAAKHLSTTADAFSGTASSASTAIQGVQTHLAPVFDAATGTLMRSATLVADIDSRTGTLFAKADETLAGMTALETNPDIPKILDSGKTISFNFAATTTDFQTRFHLILFPPPCKTFGCKVARAYPYIKDAAQLGEASYWTRELLTGGKP